MPTIQIGSRPLVKDLPSDRANQRAGFKGDVAILMDVKSKTPSKHQPHIGAKQQAKWAKQHQS